MAEAKRTKKEEIRAVTIVPPTPKTLVLEGDPMVQLEFAQKAAKALMSVVNRKANPVMINGKQFLEFGDMQTLGRFFGATVGVEWTKKIEKGWEARAIVHQHGEIISSAEAQCTKEERKWASRDDFQVRSMAQTRASSKALKNAFGWVAELAGYSSTPAEEMDGVEREPMKSYEVPKKSVDDKQFLEQDEILEVQKDKIKTLLADLGHTGLTLTSARSLVYKLTGKLLEEENYDLIIEKLKTLSPIEKLGTIE